MFSEETARQLIYMMHRVVTDGTGKRAMVSDTEVAGKTGTTQEARDAWFIGFSADYITGVWMGYDDNTPLTGVTGAACLPISGARPCFAYTRARLPGHCR